jgi:hypothetical protein
VQKFTALINALAAVAFVGLLGWATYYIRGQFVERGELEAKNEQLEDHVRERDERIGQLGDEVQAKSAEIDRLGVDLEAARQQVRDLETAMWLLKLNHRVARFEVLEQSPDPANPGQVITRVRFLELGTDGQPVGEPREFEIQGKQLYVEGLVIKFEDNFVEGGDRLRGTSVAILRRAFSENQAPSQGTPLDMPRMHPLPGHDDDIGDPFYEELWERFWDFANDPAAAAEKGVRAMHAEAPSIEMREGKTYRVELRASGGLSIHAEN